MCAVFFWGGGVFHHVRPDSSFPPPPTTHTHPHRFACPSAADSGLDDTLQLLLDRLGNEITRLSAVRAVHEVATSPLDINMSAIYEPSVAHLVSFVRKNDRTLQQSALHCLRAFVSNYPAMVRLGRARPRLDCLVGA